MAYLQNKIENAALRAVFPLWTSLHRPAPPRGKKLDFSQFTLVFEDDFSVLNREIWHPHLHQDGTPITMRKGGFWSEEQAFIENNQLHIRSEYKKDGKFGAGYYSAALSTSQCFEQTYGYFECRCCLPAAQGLWSSFWLQSYKVHKGTSPSEGMEIDVFESPLYKRRGDNSIITTNLHYNGYGLGHRHHTVGFFKADNPYEQFNTYGVLWNEHEYVFYINGRETARSSFGGVSQSHEYMLLSVETDGTGGTPEYGWSGDIRKNPDGILPADFVVDYVRVYQYTSKL